MINFKKDKTIEPNNENLKLVLGDSFSSYLKIKEYLTENEIDSEWRFYKDGGWLFKVTYKKKPIFFAQPEENYFATGCHFNERTKHGVYDLGLSEKLIKQFQEAPLVAGKFTSLKVDVYSEADLPDLFKLVDYKKKLK